MKVFMNKPGELAVGELAFVCSSYSYAWKLFNGHEVFLFFVNPKQLGWEYLGEL